MKIKFYLPYLLLITILILAACGNSTSNNHDAEEELDEDETEEDNEGTDSNSNATDEEEDEQSPADDAFFDQAKEVESDAQDYSMYILPNYTLTSEEPGRDSLYLTDNGEIFMRIETLPKNQETIDHYNENAKDILKAMAADGAHIRDITDPKDLPAADNIQDATGYEVVAEGAHMTAYVFERDGLAVRLTIFDTKDQKYRDDFLKMGSTVRKN